MHHLKVHLQNHVSIMARKNHSSENCFSQHPDKLADFRARCAARVARGCGTDSNPSDLVFLGS